MCTESPSEVPGSDFLLSNTQFLTGLLLTRIDRGPDAALSFEINSMAGKSIHLYNIP